MRFLNSDFVGDSLWKNAVNVISLGRFATIFWVCGASVKIPLEVKSNRCLWRLERMLAKTRIPRKTHASTKVLVP